MCVQDSQYHIQLLNISSLFWAHTHELRIRPKKIDPKAELGPYKPAKFRPGFECTLDTKRNSKLIIMKYERLNSKHIYLCLTM